MGVLFLSLVPFPNKKYHIIYADPPWEYGNYSNGKDTRSYDHEKGCFDSKFKITPYKGMDIKDILALPVKGITKENTALFLWVTYPCLQWGLDVIKAWGFEYKTVAFTWVKRNKNKPGYFFGLGNYTRANAEICLLGIKGSMKRLSNNVHQVIDVPISNHSQKPDIARTNIIRLFGDLPRIELFARTRIHGWDVWGNDEKLELQPLEAFNIS